VIPSRQRRLEAGAVMLLSLAVTTIGILERDGAARLDAARQPRLC